MTSIAPKPVIKFESSVSVIDLTGGIRAVLKGEEPGSNPLPANFSLEGHIDGSLVRLQRKPGLRRRRVEFWGVLLESDGKAGLVGQYVDLLSFRRFGTIGVLLAGSLLTTVEAFIGWQTSTSVPLIVVSILLGISAYLANRFHLLNRDSERDLLRNEINLAISRITGRPYQSSPRC
jgi:hypothetical protein